MNHQTFSSEKDLKDNLKVGDIIRFDFSTLQTIELFLGFNGIHLKTFVLFRDQKYKHQQVQTSRFCLDDTSGASQLKDYKFIKKLI